MVAALLGQRETDQTASMRRHEIDNVRGRHLRGNDQIPFILSLFIVDQDKHPSVPRLLDDILDRREKFKSSRARRTSRLLMETRFSVSSDILYPFELLIGAQHIGQAYRSQD